MVGCRNLGCYAYDMAWSWKDGKNEDQGEHIWACSQCAWKDTVGHGAVKKKGRLRELSDFPKPCAPISRMVFPVQEARKRSEQAYRNELRDPDKETHSWC